MLFSVCEFIENSCVALFCTVHGLYIESVSWNAQFVALRSFGKKKQLFFRLSSEEEMCTPHIYSLFNCLFGCQNKKATRMVIKEKQVFFFIQLFIDSNCNYIARNNRLLAKEYLMFIIFQIVFLLCFSICFISFIFILLLYITSNFRGVCGQPYM